MDVNRPVQDAVRRLINEHNEPFILAAVKGGILTSREPSRVSIY